MTTSVQFTDKDRDAQGYIKVPAPAPDRTLADLLPSAAPAPASKPIGRQELLAMAMVAAIVLLALFYVSRSSPAAPALERPTLIITATPPLAQPSAAPVASVAMFDAYASPFGLVLGQIEATRAITPTAHYGEDWIQADVAGSGRIWLRASDWPALALTGADLAPRAPAAAPAPAPAPARALEEAAPTPTPGCITAADIRFRAPRTVFYNGKPIADVEGTSCYSQAEAEQNADAWEAAEVKIYLAHPTSTPLASATPMPLQPPGRQDAIRNHLANEHAP